MWRISDMWRILDFLLYPNWSSTAEALMDEIPQTNRSLRVYHASTSQRLFSLPMLIGATDTEAPF